jgi:hypothetical protein
MGVQLRITGLFQNITGGIGLVKRRFAGFPKKGLTVFANHRDFFLLAEVAKQHSSGGIRHADCSEKLSHCHRPVILERAQELVDLLSFSVALLQPCQARRSVLPHLFGEGIKQLVNGAVFLMRFNGKTQAIWVNIEMSAPEQNIGIGCLGVVKKELSSGFAERPKPIQIQNG